MSIAIHRLAAADDALRPLFEALHAAQIAAAPSLGGQLPARAVDEAWAHRRGAYDQWLAVPGAFVLVATEGDRAVGFALVTLGGGYHGWESGERVAEIKDVSVAADVRGRGIGTQLMDAVEAELARAGVTEVRLNVIEENEAALRFYRRRGLVHVTSVLLGRVPGAHPAPPGT